MSRTETVSQQFPDGGYTVLRSGEGAEEQLLLLDHGPLGYLSIAAHGHADALSLVMHLGGRPVLVDPGTFTYHEQPSGGSSSVALPPTTRSQWMASISP